MNAKIYRKSLEEYKIKKFFDTLERYENDTHLLPIGERIENLQELSRVGSVSLEVLKGEKNWKGYLRETRGRGRKYYKHFPRIKRFLNIEKVAYRLKKFLLEIEEELKLANEILEDMERIFLKYGARLKKRKIEEITVPPSLRSVKLPIGKHLPQSELVKRNILCLSSKDTDEWYEKVIKKFETNMRKTHGRFSLSSSKIPLTDIEHRHVKEHKAFAFTQYGIAKKLMTVDYIQLVIYYLKGVKPSNTGYLYAGSRSPRKANIHKAELLLLYHLLKIAEEGKVKEIKISLHTRREGQGEGIFPVYEEVKTAATEIEGNWVIFRT
ncbi:MAG: hypothetical protein QF775_01755 [archaeon]|nr:hypothetical protein [Euryarchaeota archaeon]MDP6528016.1 hypothetical protein [Candidatus Paceibacterota bacterium]MDP6704191.1 hypothetical protein [archaeon]HIK01421.1 hypothetical protein [Candidatus Undinarchaeales archaeon ERR594346 U_76725]